MNAHEYSCHFPRWKRVTFDFERDQPYRIPVLLRVRHLHEWLLVDHEDRLSKLVLRLEGVVTLLPVVHQACFAHVWRRRDDDLRRGGRRGGGRRRGGAWLAESWT